MSAFLYLAALLLVGIAASLRSSSPFSHIPGPPPRSWSKGNMGQLFSAKGLSFHQFLVDQFGGVVKIFGLLGDEQLYISDPRALHSILVANPDAFEETPVFIETNKMVFGPGLVATTGDIHKRQRQITSPIFSVAQLRNLTPVFYGVADRLCSAMAEQVVRNATVMPEVGIAAALDMSEWMSRAALESVGLTVLGYSFDPLDSPRNNPYTSAIKDLIPTLFSLSLLQLAPLFSHVGTPWFRRKVVEFLPFDSVQRVKDTSDIMYQTARNILSQKQASLLSKHPLDLASERNRDIISVLLRANENTAFGERLSESELIGQMTVLIFGAQDTTASALSRVLYMLSSHPEMQEEVRKEARSAMANGKENGRLSYDELMRLPLLDAVIKETLRLYPPVPFVSRKTIQDTRILLSTPIDALDGMQMDSVMVPAGTTVFLSIAGANRLPSIWGTDAKDWKPERWLESGTTSPDNHRLPGVYAGMMSFLGGPRSCIGVKFAQIEMKILVTSLLSRFKFALTKDEIVWSLSQIVSPSVRPHGSHVPGNGKARPKRGMPLLVQMLADEDMEPASA